RLDDWVGNQKVARGYFPKGEAIRERYRLRPDGGAGFFSSVEDLLRYATFHLDTSGSNTAQILKHETIASMHEERDNKAPNYNRYSMGWGIINTKNHQILISDGRMLGSSAVVLIEPDSQTGIVLVTNVVTNALISAAVQMIDALTPAHAGEIGEYIEK